MAENISQILEILAKGEAVNDEQADMVFNAMMDGKLDPAQSGAFLMGLRAKGEDSTELASGVRAGLSHAKKIPGLTDKSPFKCIDTCGTGGDNTNSFNCSTAVALILADMGHKVVKHGNRAVSSSCGSADALEALGVPLNVEPEKVMDELDKDNFVFLFAQAYHPAFAHIAPVRKALGIRTLFNFMGPLLNPARPTHQLIGVGDPNALMLMGETMLLTGVEKALIIHGAGGFDELTTFGPARGYLIENGRMEKAAVNPDRLGFEKHSPEAVQVKDKDEAVAALKAILGGHGPKAMMDMVALNLAACLHLLNSAPLEECAETAKAKVAKGLDRGLPGA